MVDMFLMMIQEVEGEERNMLFMDEVVKKAVDMFKCLDVDGDGDVTEVKMDDELYFLFLIFRKSLLKDVLVTNTF